MSQLKATAKEWKPNSEAKEFVPRAPAAPVAAAPAQNAYSNQGYAAPAYNQGYNSYNLLPYLDENGYAVYPMVPSIMVLPSGENVQIGMVQNPQYQPTPNSWYIDYYGNPVGYLPYAPVPAPAPVDPSQAAAAAAAAPAAPEGDAAPASDATAEPVAEEAATAAPAESAASSTAATAVETAPAAAEKAAAAAATPAKAPEPVAAVVEKTEKLSIETPNSIRPTTDADHKAANGKLTYSRKTLVELYEKSSITAAEASIKAMYERFAAKCREPLPPIAGLSMKGSNSHSNLSAANSSNNLSALRGKGDDRVERGQKVPGKEKHQSKYNAEKERRERAEREDDLYYNDPNTPLPSPGMMGEYKSVFATLSLDEVEITVKKANLVLNKLSVTKFDKLSDEFMAVGLLESPALMARAVDLIVQKAQMEEHFCFMYADLCFKIVKQGTAIIGDGSESPVPTEGGDEEGEGKAAGPKTMGDVFRTQLLERCQAEFETDRAEALAAIRNNAELEADVKTEKEIVLKKRFTGTMRFIGELFLKDLIRVNTMSSCIEMLMANTEEEDMMCLCKLFQTVGKLLESSYADKAKASKSKSKRAKYEAVVPDYFVKVEQLAETHASSRVRFMLRDLVDLRSNAWVPRREAEKVVSLENKTAAASSASEPNSPKGGAVVQDAWTTVGGPGKKSSSSANLASMGGNSGKLSANFKASGTTPKAGGPGGIPRSASTSQVSNANKGARDSPRGGAGADKKPFPAAKGQKPLPSERTTVVHAGGAGAASAAAAEPAAPAAVSADNSLFDKESATFRRVKNTVEEYYVNDLLEEVFVVLGELVIPAHHLQEIIKYLIIAALEKDEKNRASLGKLIVAMHQKGLLSREHVGSGIVLFLHEFDDIVIDVPLAGSYAAEILGALVAADALNLGLFNSIPEDNNFFYSSQRLSFIVSILSVAAKSKSEEAVKELLVASGLDLPSLVNCGPREDKNQVFKDLLAKHNVAFLA